jgi:predicted Rossmann fold nucleotide-binding protein DprA/Smf involved in DNA uptake
VSIDSFRARRVNFACRYDNGGSQLVQDAKRRLEEERRDVLRELRKAAREELRARQQAQERRRRVRGLIDRGRDVDVPVMEMAQALGVTRQAVYALKEREERR